MATSSERRQGNRYKTSNWGDAEGDVKDKSQTVDGVVQPVQACTHYILRKKAAMNKRTFEILAETDFLRNLDMPTRREMKANRCRNQLFETRPVKGTEREIDIFDCRTGNALVRVRPTGRFNTSWQFLRYDAPAFEGQPPENKAGDQGRDLFKFCLFEYDGIGKYCHYVKPSETKPVNQDGGRKGLFKTYENPRNGVADVANPFLKLFIEIRPGSKRFQTYLPLKDGEDINQANLMGHWFWDERNKPAMDYENEQLPQKNEDGIVGAIVQNRQHANQEQMKHNGELRKPRVRLTLANGTDPVLHMCSVVALDFLEFKDLVGMAAKRM